MKQFLAFLIVIGIISILKAQQPSADSTNILSHSGKVETQRQEFLQSLDERIENLEDTRKTLNVWIGVLGLPLAGLSVYTIYLAFWGIKSKAEKEVEKQGQYYLEKLAPNIIARELENHPVVREYYRIQKIKQQPIAVLGYEKKDSDLDTFFSQKGFKATFFQIDDFESINPNEFKLLLFNNADGKLNQENMDKVCQKHKSAFNYFYFKGNGGNWDNSEIKMAGFASTAERLENNLVDALAKYVSS